MYACCLKIKVLASSVDPNEIVLQYLKLFLAATPKLGQIAHQLLSNCTVYILYFYPPTRKGSGDIAISLASVRLSVCPSVRPSVRP